MHPDTNKKGSKKCKGIVKGHLPNSVNDLGLKAYFIDYRIIHSFQISLIFLRLPQPSLVY